VAHAHDRRRRWRPGSLPAPPNREPVRPQYVDGLPPGLLTSCTQAQGPFIEERRPARIQLRPAQRTHAHWLFSASLPRGRVQRSASPQRQWALPAALSHRPTPKPRLPGAGRDRVIGNVCSGRQKRVIQRGVIVEVRTQASRLREAAVVRIPSAYGVPAKPNSRANLLESKR
jgi:hypothetical protein